MCEILSVVSYKQQHAKCSNYCDTKYSKNRSKMLVPTSYLCFYDVSFNFLAHFDENF